MNDKITLDKIIFKPGDIDLSHSPLRNGISEETYVLGAFNPGLTRLPNGNLLLMVRVAEALKKNIKKDKLLIIRKPVDSNFTIEEYDSFNFNTNDPRKYLSKEYAHSKIYALTSYSWLLPVELTNDGTQIIKIHYDKIVQPEKSYQEYGMEDARITEINNKYYMTVCCVGSERHPTVLYTSENGLIYKNLGVIQDHQNKDMVLFPEKIGDYYYGLTRPLGDHYFISSPKTSLLPGPSINISRSPDLLHWKPLESPLITMQKDTRITKKLGAGSQPILTNKGWLILFHGVGDPGEIGSYKTYWALLDKENPSLILKIDLHNEILKANYNLTNDFNDKKYVGNVVFTTGIDELDNRYIIASGELDLYCRITHLSKSYISNLF
ncbi:glycosidase [Bacteroidota bacterium]